MKTLTNNYMVHEALPWIELHDYTQQYTGQVDCYIYTGLLYDMFPTLNEQLKCFLKQHQTQRLVINCDWEGGFNVPEEIIFKTVNELKISGVEVVILIQNERLSKNHKNIFYIHRCWWMQTAGWNDHVININNYQSENNPEYKFNYILGTPRKYKIDFISQPDMLELFCKHGVSCNLSYKVDRDPDWEKMQDLQSIMENKFSKIDRVIKSRAVDSYKISTSQHNKFLHRDGFYDLDADMQLFFAALPYCFANSRFSVVQETEMTTAANRYTEKTIRPIELGQMFIIAGNYKCLQLLQADGFETFSQWIDESYDIEPDRLIRGEKITKQIEMLCGLSDNQWNDLAKEITPVVEHNKQHLKNLRDKYTQQLSKALNYEIDDRDSPTCC